MIGSAASGGWEKYCISAEHMHHHYKINPEFIARISNLAVHPTTNYFNSHKGFTSLFHYSQLAS
jgi:hypothetical protein